MKFDFDLFVIGAGSGGVRAARAAADYGARVAIAEESRIGGTCVIRGCVPKKLLVFGAHFAEDFEDARRFGWHVEGVRFDWPTLRDNVLAEVSRLSGAYRQSLEHRKVEILTHHATIVSPSCVSVAGRELTAEKILIATGAHPYVPTCPGSEHGITSNDAFHLETLPPRIVISGAGYIANEFAGIFNQLGSEVTVVNRSGAILRGYDEQIRHRLLELSQAKGIRFVFNAPIEHVRKHEGGLTIHLKGHDPIECSALMFAAGRIPNTRGLALEKAGVETDTLGAIRVDDDNRSTCGSIFAVGDVTNRVQLTPVAIREAQVFADTFFGNKPTKMNYDCIPSAVFSHPPLAGVGLTETQARERFRSVKVYVSDFRPMKNVVANRNERALYKLVVDEATNRVVGAHLIGPGAPEILQPLAIAVKAGLTKAQFDECVAIHPTMAEELVLMK